MSPKDLALILWCQTRLGMTEKETSLFVDKAFRLMQNFLKMIQRGILPFYVDGEKYELGEDYYEEITELSKLQITPKELTEADSVSETNQEE